MTDWVPLLNGKNLSGWERPDAKAGNWKVEDGAMVDDANDIISKEKFGDFKLHIEFNEPKLGPEFKGQDRGNSGIYLQGRYEIQILDSYHNDTYATGACGALYGVIAPAKNACKPPEPTPTNG